MLIIGENINASNKSVKKAIEGRDIGFVKKLATDQVAGGVDWLDINAGTGQVSSMQEAHDLGWLIEAVQEVTDKPLVIDSADPRAIKAGLAKYKGSTPIINSINAEDAKLETLPPLVKKYEAKLIAIAIDNEGIPSRVEERIRACDKIMERLSSYGIAQSQVFFDPVVLPISVDTSQGLITLKTLEEIKSRYPEAKTTLGLSNVSYGLPLRSVVNRAFLLPAMYIGLDSVIMNPLDHELMGYLKVGMMLMGKDPFCKEYLTAYRKGIFKRSC